MNKVQTLLMNERYGLSAERRVVAKFVEDALERNPELDPWSVCGSLEAAAADLRERIYKAQQETPVTLHISLTVTEADVHEVRESFCHSLMKIGDRFDNVKYSLEVEDKGAQKQSEGANHADL